MLFLLLQQFIIQTRFVCQFNIEGRVTSVNARLLADTIYCDEAEFSYTSRAPNITVPFAVIWGGSKPLDNPDNIHVVIYRCRDMADNCGICLALAQKYNCGWCQSSDRCEVKEQCDNASDAWLNSTQTCPNPEIHSFQPSMGPWEGHTNVTIRGINLGKTYEDIYGGITVASMRCLPFRELYVHTKEIVCRVDGPGAADQARTGPVFVQIEGFRGQSKTNFEFVDPLITNISPRHGPLSGGTIVKITGNYLNAGSTIRAVIDDLPCNIIRAGMSEALCITSSSAKKRNGTLKMIFDDVIREYNGLFSYVDDPVIVSVESGSAGTKIPKGIPAGGVKISVTGKNLEFIQNPQIYVYHEGKMFMSQCEVLRPSNNMMCSSPTVDVRENIDSERPLMLEYGFLMDNVTGVQNLSQHSFNSFLLYPNPIYEEFDEEVKYYKSDYLTINGQHLDRASKESDVIVQIGNEFCNVTSLSRQQLTCRPPDSQPAALDEDGVANKQELPEVICFCF